MLKKRRITVIAFFVIIVAIMVSLRSARPRGGTSLLPLVLSPCRITGLDPDARCGRLEVYENRKAGSGRKIGLNVVVIPSLAQPAPSEPLFLLAGGPGQSIVTVAPGLPFLTRLRRQRDIVLVDQRGTGGSGALSCGDAAEANVLALFEDDLSMDRVRDCLGQLAGDPRFYTTDLAMADLDDVRRALGYERINLWGASYGTRAALVYMKMFPDRARAAILDGVAPYGNRLPLFMARDADRALQLLYADCAAASDCAAAFPQLEAKLRRVYERLAAAPARLRLRHPITGEETDAVLSAETFMGVVRFALYSADLTAMLPWIVSRAEAGDFGPFGALAEQGRGSLLRKASSPGLLLSVICAEDVPFIAPGELRSSSLFSGSTARLAEPCSLWPHGTVPIGLREPVTSDVPTLLLSGALDPVTPPSWAEEAARTLRHARHFVVPGAGHGVSVIGCVPRLLDRFLKDGQLEGVDPGCLAAERRPPFVVGLSGPRP
jgi:pimeloyl-ACP methyl ester carboxylesterase